MCIRSEVGTGSCFWFDIELDRDPAYEGTGLDQTGNVGLRLLVVDDNDVARDILSKMVSGLGWTADTAHSAAAAFHQIRDQGAYDLTTSF